MSEERNTLEDPWSWAVGGQGALEDLDSIHSTELEIGALRPAIVAPICIRRRKGEEGILVDGNEGVESRVQTEVVDYKLVITVNTVGEENEGSFGGGAFIDLHVLLLGLGGVVSVDLEVSLSTVTLEWKSHYKKGDSKGWLVVERSAYSK